MVALNPEQQRALARVREQSAPLPAPPTAPTAAMAPGIARALGQGALFSFGDEAEAYVRSMLTGEEYEEALERIRREYGAFSEQNPGISTGAELASGLAASFIPVAGQVGRLAQAGRAGAGLLSPAARIAAAGTGSGALSGFGAGEGGLANRAGMGAVGAGLGLGLSAVPGASGLAGRAVRDTYGALRGRLPDDRAASSAQDIILKTLQREGKSPSDVQQEAELAARYGVPLLAGQTTPGLAALTETIVQRPGQTALAGKLAGQLTEAPTRARALIGAAFKSPDYFAEEAKVLEGMQERAAPAYREAYDVGTIDDPRINALLDNKQMADIFADTRSISENLATAARVEGADPSPFQLVNVFDPVFNAAGALVGHKKTGVLPDVRTLDNMKRAMDGRIDSLYRSGDSANANALKAMRNAMVDRLDTIAPEYKAARAIYAGDAEIREALEYGRTQVAKDRPQELSAWWASASPGAREAARTGVLQRMSEPMEDASGLRNWAQRYGSESWRDKLSTMLSPGESSLLLPALKREAETFQSASAALMNSRTARRLEGKEALETAIAENDLGRVAELVSQPGGKVRALMAFLGSRTLASRSDAVTKRLGEILSEGDPAKIAAAVIALSEREAASAGELARRQALRSRGAAGLAAGVGPAPESSAPKPDVPVPPLAIPDFEGALDAGARIPVPFTQADLDALGIPDLSEPPVEPPAAFVVPDFDEE